MIKAFSVYIRGDECMVIDTENPPAGFDVEKGKWRVVHEGAPVIMLANLGKPHREIIADIEQHEFSKFPKPNERTVKKAP